MKVANVSFPLHTMDRVLTKLYSGRKELRKTEPAFLRGLTKVPVLQLGELSKNSFHSPSPRADTCRLPKIAKTLPAVARTGSQTHRSALDHLR